MDTTIPMEVVKGKIYLIRGQKVFLDNDLAELYGIAQHATQIITCSSPEGLLQQQSAQGVDSGFDVKGLTC